METSLKTEHITGSMGSDFYRLKVPPKMFSDFARNIDWNKFGKRVMIDAKAGIISWMSPGTTHEDMGYDTGEIVRRASSLLKMVIRGKRSTRWRRPEDPEDSGFEPDASFYFGEKARNYFMIYRNGTDDEIKHYAATNPPDLVVEVEVTNFDADKPDIYKDIGVRELWQAKYRPEQKPEVTILDLQVEGGPRAIEASLVLPGLKAATLVTAYTYASEGRYNDLTALLKEELVVPVPKKDTSEPPPSRPSGPGM